jgi:hypothetical protein
MDKPDIPSVDPRILRQGYIVGVVLSLILLVLTYIIADRYPYQDTAYRAVTPLNHTEGVFAQSVSIFMTCWITWRLFKYGKTEGLLPNLLLKHTYGCLVVLGFALIQPLTAIYNTRQLFLPSPHAFVTLTCITTISWIMIVITSAYAHSAFCPKWLPTHAIAIGVGISLYGGVIIYTLWAIYFATIVKVLL